MFGKINELKKQMEESKQRLDSIFVEHQSPGGEVHLTMAANYAIKDIHLSVETQEMDREELEDVLVLAMNKAFGKAKNANESEMKNVAGGLVPGLNLPGL
ncbi:MAG: DNA-binding protein YbaB [Luteibaculaceae bacterium]|jgi:DNA-binding protein YbaB